MINRLNIARGLIIFGFLYGLSSLTATMGHIGDPAYLVQPEFGGGQGHSYYHALREVFGDIAAMLVVIFIFFAKPELRKPGTWCICLMLALGYYLPYWVGMPFMEELAAPDLRAELNHLIQAGFVLAGLLYGRREFYSAPPAPPSE